MNQNNNIIGYDSQTGEPIYGNQNTNIKQPQTNIEFTQPQTNQPKKNNKGLIILAILIVATIFGIILYFNNQDKDIDNDNLNDSKVENNSSVGGVEEGTNTTYDENGAFLFNIEDVFTVTGKGTFVTGKVQRGKIKVGDKVQIVGLGNEILTTEITMIELTKEQKEEEATIGKYYGIGLKDITRTQVKRGQVLAEPNSIATATKFDADVHILTKEEGGKQISFSDGYSAKFFLNIIGSSILGVIDLPDNIKTVNSGDDVSFTVTLESNIAMEVGTEFSIREDSREIGKGTITKIY